MSSRIEIEEKVLDGEQVGPVTIDIDSNDLVGEVTIEDRILDGTGTEIVVEVSESLGIVGVDELVEVRKEIDASKNKAEEAANKAADLINDADNARKQLERDVEQIKDLTDQSTKNAATATNKAAEATTQANIATTKADEASSSKDEATKQAGIATAQANEAESYKNAAAGSERAAGISASTATTQAGIATTKATEADKSAKAAEVAAGKAATDTSDLIRAEFKAQVDEATKQAGIATTQANNASGSAQVATQQANTATDQQQEATKQAGIATAQATQAASYANSADSAKAEATTQAGIATVQAGTATTQAKVATTQANKAKDSAADASRSASSAQDQVAAAQAAGTKAVQDKFNAIEPTLDSKVQTATNQAGIATQKATQAAASQAEATKQVGLAKDEVAKAEQQVNLAKEEVVKATTQATNAGDSASQAATSEANAKTSEDKSAEHETKALQYRNEAEGFKNQANSAKDTAVQQAGNASRSAATSTTQAGNAKTEADRAKNIADSLKDISGGKFGVTSINGQVGIIENFDYQDVNAKPASYIPSWGELSGKPDLFTESEADAKYLPKGGKAANSDKLDGLDSTSFVKVTKAPNRTDLNKLLKDGHYRHDNTVVNGPGFNTDYGQTIVSHGSGSDTTLQITSNYYSSKIAWRSFNNTLSAGGTWNEFYHTGHKPTWVDVGGNNWLFQSGAHTKVGSSRWLRASGNNTGFLPDANHQSYLGASGWSFKEAWVDTYKGGNADLTGNVSAVDITAKGKILPYNAIQKASRADSTGYYIGGTDGYFEIAPWKRGSAQAQWGDSLRYFEDTGRWCIGGRNNKLYSEAHPPSLDDVNPLKSITKNITANADTWVDVLGNVDIPTSGVYTLLIEYDSHTHGGKAWRQHYTGQFYWYSGNTDSRESSEIMLHHMGHAELGEYLYARTLEAPIGKEGTQSLQIRCDSKITNCPFTIKLRRIM